MKEHLKTHLYAAGLSATLSIPLLFVDAAALVKALVVFNIHAFILAAMMILKLKKRLVYLACASKGAEDVVGFIVRSVGESEKRGN
jgi:hypothetical protein